MLKDARKLRLINSIFNFRVVIEFYSKDSFYTGISSTNWRFVNWAFPGKPPVLLWETL